MDAVCVPIKMSPSKSVPIKGPHQREWKRKTQEKIYDETKNMTWEERATYFRKGTETGPLAEWVKKIKTSQERRDRRKAS